MEITAIKSDVGMKWEMVKLGDVCDVLGGYAFKSENFKNEGVPLLRISNITDGEVSFKDDCICVEDSNLSSLQRFKVIKGDILLALSGATTGKFGVYKLDYFSFLNQRVGLIRSTEKTNQKYLLYYLNVLKSQIEQIAQGAAQPNISTNEISNLQIPLPPLATQKRIAEILDAADALRRKDQALLQKYDELAQAIFMDMFGDPVKNEKGFNFIKLGDCLANIQIGPFGTQLHESDYIKNGIPIINPMHIGDLKIKPNYNYSISEAKYSELPQYHLKEDDIILGRRGEMGRCAIVTKNQGRCLCGTGSLYLSVNKDLLDPLFLVYILSRKSTKIALENVSAGTTMANLNKDIINNFKIILPKLEKQKDFVKAIKMSEKSIDFTNLQIEKSSYIFQTLLQKAFKGALVP